MKLLIASRNPGKIGEIRTLFSLPGLVILGTNDLPGLPDVEEDGATFEANAVKKAEALSRASGLPALADDSGLEVDALHGAPGVISARYAGAHGNDRANLEKVLRELGDRTDRTARFRCVLALALPGRPTQVIAAACEGVIARGPRGNGGFGYDPIFLPAGHEQTFGEMTAAQKNALSHRGKALREAARAWRSFLLPPA